MICPLCDTPMLREPERDGSASGFAKEAWRCPNAHWHPVPESESPLAFRVGHLIDALDRLTTHLKEFNEGF